jgi:hypothetical protein
MGHEVSLGSHLVSTFFAIPALAIERMNMKLTKAFLMTLTILGSLTIAHIRASGDDVASLNAEAKHASERIDHAFEHRVGIAEVRSALQNLDSARLVDCALALAHTERTLLRSHSSISTADILEAAMHIAFAKADRVSLDRLEHYARAVSDTHLMSLITQNTQLVADSRAVFPELSIDAASTSDEERRIATLVVQDLERARLEGGRAKANAIATFVQETYNAKIVSESVKTRLQAYITEVTPMLPIAGAMDENELLSKTLAKLSSDSRVPWGPVDAGFKYYSFGGHKVRLIANLYAIPFDRDSLGRASQAIAKREEASGARSHIWDDNWYVKELPDNGSQILLLIAHDTHTGGTRWVAVKNTPSQWIVMKGDGRPEYPGNGEMVKRVVTINGKDLHFDIRNPHNRYDAYYKEWATPNHIWYSFGY